MSKVVPEGWSIRKLDGKIKILSGFPFKSEFFTNDPEYMGIIRIRDLDKQNLETFYTDDFEEQYIVTKGDVLIGMDGDFNIVKWKSADALLNQRVCKIKAKDNSGFDTDFLFQSLKEDLLKIHATTGATTVKHLSVKDIRGIEKAYPPLPEQQKIATILSSVDNVIEKTRAQIDKLKNLKTGMMQELLTKGIGHTESKNSEGWEIFEIGELATQVKPGPFGSSLTKAMYTKHGYKVYGQEQVISGDLKAGDYYIDQNKYNELSAFKIFAGDILISLVGTFGQIAVVPDEFESGVINPRLLILRLPLNKVDVGFIAQQLKSEYVIKQLEQLQQGGTMGVLSATTIKPLKLMIPPLKQQRLIGQMMQDVDRVVSNIEAKLGSVEVMKKALMQDLLVGKVRVFRDA